MLLFVVVMVLLYTIPADRHLPLMGHSAGCRQLHVLAVAVAVVGVVSLLLVAAEAVVAAAAAVMVAAVVVVVSVMVSVVCLWVFRSFLLCAEIMVLTLLVQL